MKRAYSQSIIVLFCSYEFPCVCILVNTLLPKVGFIYNFCLTLYALSFGCCDFYSGATDNPKNTVVDNRLIGTIHPFLDPTGVAGAYPSNCRVKAGFQPGWVASPSQKYI